MKVYILINYGRGILTTHVYDSKENAIADVDRLNTLMTAVDSDRIYKVSSDTHGTCLSARFANEIKNIVYASTVTNENGDVEIERVVIEKNLLKEHLY